MASHRYVIRNAKLDRWDVVKEGHRRATAYADTKSKAVARARDLVRQEGGGEVRVMNSAGKITDARTVSRQPSRSRPKAA